MIVQIETKTVIEKLDEIDTVDGVNGVLIGPSDLHASFGYRRETANPEVLPIIDDAIGRISQAGKASGIPTGVEANARRWLDLG